MSSIKILSHILSLGLCILLTACAHNGIRVIEIPEKALISIPESISHAVPLIPQFDNYSCATTSAAMAISFLEKTATPLNKNDVWALSGTEIETVLRYGNDMSGLKKIADHYGYKSEYANNIDIPKLEYLLSIGAMPILNIKQNDNGSGGGSHAVLAIGYSKSDQTIYINDPAMQLSAFDYKRLERRWSANLSSPPGSSYQSAFIIYPSKQ